MTTFEVPPSPFATSPSERMVMAMHYIGGRFGVPSEWLSWNAKTGQVLIHDRPADEEGAKVTTILRPSRTGSGLWFEVDDGDIVAMHDFPKGTWRD